MLPKNRSIRTAQLALLCMVIGTGCSNESLPKIEGSTDMPGNVEQNSETETGTGTGIEVAVETETGTGVVEQNVPEIIVPTDPTPGLGAGSAAIENAALIFIAEENGPVRLTISSSARFYSITTPLDFDPVLKPMPMLDTCEIGSEVSQINGITLDLPIDHLLEAAGDEILQVAAIAAGDTIELSSEAGSYASLVKNSDADGIQYNPADGAELNTLVPDALSINIMGDEFPALESKWTTPARLNAAMRDDVRSGASFTWTAANTSDSTQSRLHVYAGFINELTGQTDSYQCVLADDGEFTLPENVQALYGNGSSANFVDVARYSRSVQMVGDISVVNVFLQRF